MQEELISDLVLNKAALNGDVKAFAQRVESGVGENSTTKIIQAAKFSVLYNKKDIVFYVVGKVFTKADLTEREQLLFASVKYGRKDILEYLLSSKNPVPYETPSMVAALPYALVYDVPELVQEIIENSDISKADIAAFEKKAIDAGASHICAYLKERNRKK